MAEDTKHPAIPVEAEATRRQLARVVAGATGTVEPAKRPPPPKAQVRPAVAPARDKVVRLPSNIKAPIVPRAGLAARSKFLWRFAAVFIGLPTLVTFLYFALWASPQYVSEARFAIRGADQIGGGAEVLGGLLSGLAGSSPGSSDSYILVDYLNSRELVERLEKQLDLRKLYSTSEADYFARLDSSVPIEGLVDYWRKRIHATYDNTTSIITVQIRAFSPVVAQSIAASVQREAEAMVNRLSDRAQEDAVKISKEEVQHSEVRIQAIRGMMRRFRDREQIADPIATAGAKTAALATLQQQLAQVNAALNSRRPFVAEQSPTIVTLRARAEALEKEIAKARAELGGDTSNTVAGTLADYEELELQRQFAEKALVSALAALEVARTNALRLRRYLAVYVEPRVPEYAMYPKVLENTLLVFLCVSIIFGSLLLFYQSLREQMS